MRGDEREHLGLAEGYSIMVGGLKAKAERYFRGLQVEPAPDAADFGNDGAVDPATLRPDREGKITLGAGE
jgi:hypothetical protein